MLKRLFIAVFILSLTLALSGAAVASGDGPNGFDKKATPLPVSSAVTIDKGRLVNPAPAQRETANERFIDISEARTPQVFSADTTACWYYLDYIDWAGFAGSVSYFDMYGGDQISSAVRYDIPKYHYAVVEGMSFRLSESSLNNGGCDIEVSVWSDVGGVPGALLYADTIPSASLGHPVAWSGSWLSWTFNTPVTIEGETNFHVAWGPTDDSPVEDYVEMLMTAANATNVDYVTSGRSSMKYGTAWYASADFWTGGDVDNWIDASFCVEFSDCYVADPLPDPGYFWAWGMPDPAWTDPTCVWNGLGQRFVSEGPDTLTMVRFFHRDYGDEDYPLAGSDVIIEVWDDDGTGNIDYAAGPIITKTIPGDRATLFPQTGGAAGNPGGVNWVWVDYTGDDIVLYGPWHVSARMSSDDPANGVLWFPLSYEGDPTGPYHTDGTGASVNFTGNCDPWHRMDTPGSTWDSEVGLDMSYWIWPYLCRDEFYDCQVQETSGAGDWYAAYVEPYAQMVAGNPVNQVNAVYVIPHPALTVGTPDLVVTIFDAGANGPGNILYADTIAYGDWLPGWNRVVIPDVWTYGNFYVGYWSHSDDPASNNFTSLIEEGASNINGGIRWYDPGSDAWYSWEPYNLPMAVDFCSIEVEERPCGQSDWVTQEHDFQRSGASLTGLGNAQCNLTLNWAWEHPTLISQWMGPIIYDNMLITTWRSATASEYKVQDLITKADIYSFTYPNNVQGTPTVAYIDALAAPIMFVTTGADDDLVQAINLDDGTVVYTVTDAIATLDDEEKCLFANFIVLTIGADQVLFFTTNFGQVIAVNAATGAAYWAAPYKPAAMGPVNNRSGATDGEGLLFYSYATVFGGDIACLDAATGTEQWLLSTDGLKGNDAYGGGVPIEQFNAGLSYDAETGKLYTVSACTGDHPRSGCFYIIDAATGVTDHFTACNGFGLNMAPVIDKQRVYVPHLPRWVQGTNPCAIQSFRKADGLLDWCITYGEFASDEFATSDAVLTCEPNGAADQLFIFTATGHLRCIDTDEGVELFNRRITDVDWGGAAGAVALDALGDPHLVFQSVSGGVFDLTMGSARPRLEIVTTVNRQPVPFGDDANYLVTFPEVFANTGCADLVVTMDVSETSNGSVAPVFRTVSDDLNKNAATLADALTDNKLTTMLASQPFETTVLNAKQDMLSKNDGLNQAALADMSWINTPTLNYTVAPGDVQDIAIEVDQPAVGRGIFDFYVAFTTMNDPDYWLDTYNSPINPEVLVTFLGGCLKESNDLEFGDGLVNYRQVYNSSRIVDSDDGGFNWNGFAPLFQGAYFMGISEKRIAMNTTAWHGGPPEEQYTSWVPDLVEGQCIPVLTPDVNMGSYFDGTSNHAIYANVIEYNAIDSVQNFDDGAGGWDWTNYFAAFDPDSTMGLRMNHKVIGCYDFGDPSTSPVGLLGDATIDIIEFTERNGNSVPGWGINCYLDWDFRVGATVDTTQLDRSISTAWTYSVVDENGVGGMIKLPFTFCSNEADPNYVAPMKSSYAIDQREGMFNEAFLDSAWLYTQLPAGEYSHEFEDPSDGNFDMAASYTFANHDFGPHETYTMAIAQFVIEDYPDSYTSADGMMSDLAHQLNKFMGYGRGDLNNDNVINLADVVYLTNWINYGGTGPIPFEYLANVNTNTTAPYYTQDDVVFLADYYFNGGQCPGGLLKHTSKSIVEE